MFSTVPQMKRSGHYSASFGLLQFMFQPVDEQQDKLLAADRPAAASADSAKLTLAIITLTPIWGFGQSLFS